MSNQESVTYLDCLQWQVFLHVPVRRHLLIKRIS
jgi:hypothetical protein